jgi:hypothetical protein
LITITRRLALKLRTVFRRAFGTRGPGPTLAFIAGPEGLTVKARQGDVAVEFHGDAPGNAGPAECLWLPFAFLTDCAAKTDEPVEIETTMANQVVARWLDRNVPKNIPYDADPPQGFDKVPVFPESLADNPPELLQALRDAADTTDPASARFALGCVQLRASGTLAATDGRQVFIQSGFQFPWDTDLLIPSSKVFDSAELPHSEPVRIGNSGDWVAIGLGPWTIYLAVNKDGRFPDVDRHLPQAETATARCRFSADDAAFLGDTLPRLPGDSAEHCPVTFGLNGSIAVWAKSAELSQVTEVVLGGSEWSGEPIRINTDRKYLKRAMKLGFREIFLFGSDAPVFCRDERRRYGWALLESKSAIAPTTNTILIESPRPGTEAPAALPTQSRRTSIVQKDVGEESSAAAVRPAKKNRRTKADGELPANGHTLHPISHREGPRHLGSLIEQAVATRESLRDALTKTNDLVKRLKRQRQLSRSVESTLASLRQLQTLEV